MAFKGLRAWIETLEAEGELKRINVEVDWEKGELAAIAWAAIAQQGPALLFENIKDYKEGCCTKLFTNGLASFRRMALMLGLPKETPQQKLIEVMRKRYKEPVKPIDVKTGPVKENIIKGKNIDLFSFPVPKWNPLDGGRYINTYCAVVTRDPDDGKLNVGAYRGMINGKNKIGVYLVPAKDWGVHYSKYQAVGKPMPVAIVYGWDPALLVAAGTAFSSESEYDMVGALRQERVELVRCETSDLEVPASAEIVVEGSISPDPTTYETEGPFGEWTGFYGEAKKRPVIHVSCISHRNNPIFRGGPVGRRPGTASEVKFSTVPSMLALYWNILDSQGIPGVLDMAKGQMYLAIKIHKTYQGQPRQVAAALWGSKATSELPRILIVVEEDVDIYQPDALLHACAIYADFREDLVVFPAELGPGLSPILSYEEKDEFRWGAGLETKLLIDATINWRTHPVRPEWGNRRYPPSCAEPSLGIIELVQRRWKEYGF